MKPITFKLSIIVLVLSFWFSQSSFAQYSTNHHFTRGTDADEVSLTWNGTSQSADNGKGFTTSYHGPDSTNTGISTPSQVKNRYTIIPNPSSGKSKLKVQLKPQDSQLILFDLTGRLQFKIYVDPGQDNVSIDVESLSKGIYILKVLAGETVVGVEKMVIN